MPRGLNRTGDFRNGSPLTLPHSFGNPITWVPDPAHFGNPVTGGNDPKQFGNDVDWPTPDAAHFGNIIGGTPAITTGLLLENGTDFFDLEDGTGVILLEI